MITKRFQNIELNHSMRKFTSGIVDNPQSVLKVTLPQQLTDDIAHISKLWEIILTFNRI